MHELELIKQAAFQRGFEKQAAGIFKATQKGLGAIKNLFKSKPNPLFTPVAPPVPSLTSLERSILGAREISDPVLRARALLNSQQKAIAEMMAAEKLRLAATPVGQLNAAAAAKLSQSPVAKQMAEIRRARDFSQPRSLNYSGATMGLPKI